MNLRESNKLTRSVRLFPRLALNKPLGRLPLLPDAPRGRRAKVIAETDPIASARAHVKARLLKMILENEQVRRNEQRPGQL